MLCLFFAVQMLSITAKKYSGGENEISMPVKLNALRYGGYSAECILDRVEPNGNIPEKEIAGQYTASMFLYNNLIRKIKYTYIQFCF